MPRLARSGAPSDMRLRITRVKWLERASPNIIPNITRLGDWRETSSGAQSAHQIYLGKSAIMLMNLASTQSTQFW